MRVDHEQATAVAGRGGLLRDAIGRQFEIEEVDAFVKLTVIHDGFEPDSPLLNMVSQGWPRVLSALKTLIETKNPHATPIARETIWFAPAANKGEPPPVMTTPPPDLTSVV